MPEREPVVLDINKCYICHRTKKDKVDFVRLNVYLKDTRYIVAVCEMCLALSKVMRQDPLAKVGIPGELSKTEL